MPDKDINIRDLRRAVKAYKGWEDPKRGKGSHTMFLRVHGGGTYTFPIPTHDKTVAKKYVKGLRERLGLTKDDGVPDADFYSH